ncbi:MAG: Sec-independent protein translocase TatB [Actinomycetota bacterium]
MGSIEFSEVLILLVVAVVVLGPERLPKYAAQLARIVRDVRAFSVRAREQVRTEMGEEFDDVDWQALDPRRYDPRRIVRDALLDGDDDPLHQLRDDPLGLKDEDELGVQSAGGPVRMLGDGMAGVVPSRTAGHDSALPADRASSRAQSFDADAT